MLLIVIVAQLLFLAWQDHKNREEREKLEMMIMSKDVTEFKEAVEPPPPPAEVEKETHVPIDDVPLETLMSATDNI